MSEKFSLKDHLFNPHKVAQLAREITAVHADFDSVAFEKEVTQAFPDLELKARIAHIRICLKKYLPQSYRAAVEVILKALPAPLNPHLTDNDFGDFIYAPYHDFVAHYGCTQEDLTFSLAALKALTQRFSAEDAIRYFLNAFPTETMQTLADWATDTNYHVRRLCSEGTRPTLPWSQKIGLAPTAALPLLDVLHADPTRYVTRSVANHLNDISKSAPEAVLAQLQKWRKAQKQSEKELQFITKHALRTLIKNGHPQALSLMGYGNSDGIVLSDLRHDTHVKIGETLTFTFTLAATQTKEAMIDYIVHFQSKQGTLSNKKIHKLKAIITDTTQPMTFTKRHPFRANMTTRTLYKGAHKVEIQVNGSILAAFDFELMLGE